MAARIAGGEPDTERLQKKPQLDVEFGASDLAEIIYIDHYGNAFTGLRVDGMPRDARIVANGRRIRMKYASTTRRNAASPG